MGICGMKTEAEVVGGLSLIRLALFSNSSTFHTIQSAEERCSWSAASHPLCAPENRAKAPAPNTAACFRCLRIERTWFHSFFPFTVCVHQLIKYACEGVEDLCVISKMCRCVSVCVFDSVPSVIALVRLLVSLIFYS